MQFKCIFRFFWLNRNLLIVFFVPIFLLPLPVIIDSKEMKCAYAILIMALYWITEALPVPVTALLPVILFPMLEVIPSKQLSKYYVNDTTMLFIGGLLMAIAIEKWNLHKRIALRILMLFGSEPRWLILGLMINTWFLSMWISNTATTAMMMPIAQAVLQQMKKEKTQQKSGCDNLFLEMEDIGEKSIQSNLPISAEQNISNRSEINESKISTETTTHLKSRLSEEKPDCSSTVSNPCYMLVSQHLDNDGVQLESASLEEEQEKHYKRLCKAVSLSIAYAANTGGIGTLTGTGPNLVLKGQAELIFASHGLKDGVTFAKWMSFGVPLSIFLLFLTWIWLQGLFLRCNDLASCFRKNKKSQVDQKVKDVIKREYENLGPMSFSEIMVLIHFVALAFLLITRDLQSAGGWGILFREKYVSDSTPAMLIALLLFIVPSEMPKFKIEQNNDETGFHLPSPLLTWPFVEKKLPWGIVLLLGGGFALANASKDSGLSLLVSKQLSTLSSMTPWVMNMVLAFIVATVTEVASNTATATLLMPIMAELAIRVNLNPLYLMFPAALACSFAFMLPVATPPNAIVFTGGHLTVADMASAGLFVNILSVFTLTLAVNTWGDAIFNFHHIPTEFFDNNNNTTNSTIMNNTTFPSNFTLA